MPHSEGETPNLEARRQWLSKHRQMREMISRGASWSGRERNGCFLNTGGERFADISGLSGFDFADDARAIGLVDWDADGDVDLWVRNRSGPQLRLLANRQRSGAHFLAVKLEGRTANRDAIGARLKLTLADREQTPMIKTLRAGEGFLSQSSKWVHFGLGDRARIARLVVAWPGGKSESFEGLSVDQRYRIVEGSGTPDLSDRPTRQVQLAAGPISPPPVDSQARIVLAARVPLPELEYLDAAGERVALASRGPSPRLINFWASSCRPCLEELQAFVEHESSLFESGLDVVALDLDRQLDGQRFEPEKAAQAIVRLKYPFAAGSATPEMIDKLEIVHEFLFASRGQFAVPTSFLCDSDGWIAVVYRGPVEPAQLLADLELLDASPEQVRNAAVPLAGRWYHGPVIQPNLVELAREFHLAGYQTDARRYLREQMVLDRAAPENAALATFDSLAWTLATSPAAELRDGPEAVRLALPLVRATRREQPEALDILAAAYAESGKFEQAAAAARAAIELCRSQGKGSLAADVEARLRLYEQGKAYREE